MHFGFRANVCIPAENYLMGLWKLKIKQSRHGGVLDTKCLVEEKEGRYDLGQPTEGHASDISLCSHTHQRCSLQHTFGRVKRSRGFAALLLLSSTKNRKKYRVLSNFSTTVSYVIPGMCYTCTSPSTLLGNVASTETICCSCSVSRSSSLVGGRPTSSILTQSLPVAWRAFV